MYAFVSVSIRAAVDRTVVRAKAASLDVCANAVFVTVACAIARSDSAASFDCSNAVRCSFHCVTLALLGLLLICDVNSAILRLVSPILASSTACRLFASADAALSTSRVLPSPCLTLFSVWSINLLKLANILSFNCAIADSVFTSDDSISSTAATDVACTAAASTALIAPNSSRADAFLPIFAIRFLLRSLWNRNTLNSAFNCFFSSARCLSFCRDALNPLPWSR